MGAERAKKDTAAEAEEAARRRFVQDLLTRGEAVEAQEGDELPPGATHEVVEGSEEAEPQVKRRRFSAY